MCVFWIGPSSRLIARALLVFSHKLVRARLVLFSLLNAPPGIRAAHWTRRRCWAFQVLLFVSARANKHTLANILTRRRSQIALRHSSKCVRLVITFGGLLLLGVSGNLRILFAL